MVFCWWKFDYNFTKSNKCKNNNLHANHVTKKPLISREISTKLPIKFWLQKFDFYPRNTNVTHSVIKRAIFEPAILRVHNSAVHAVTVSRSSKDVNYGHVCSPRGGKIDVFAYLFKFRARFDFPALRRENGGHAARHFGAAFPVFGFGNCDVG